MKPVRLFIVLFGCFSMFCVTAEKKEKPNITFEYEEQTAWGKGFNRDRIINNYLELQSRLKEYGFNSAIHPLTSP